MFKQLAALTNLMKNTGDIQRRMEEVKERLERAQVEGRSACGQVKVTITGKMHVLAVNFAADPSVLGSKNVIEALVQEAVNDGLRKAKDLAGQELRAVAEGLGLPSEMLAKIGLI